MITPNDLEIAINKAIVSIFPDDMVYVNLQPKDFKRPSTLIECVRVAMEDVNCKTVSVTAYYTLTCFVEIDGHYNSDTERLLKRQTDVLNLFRSGYIKVGDRQIKTLASTGGIDFTAVYIDLQFEYFDDRSYGRDDTPLMEAVKTNVYWRE